LSQFIDQAGPEIAATVEPHLTPVLVQVWSQHASNPHLCGSIVDVFQSIASNPSALLGLQSRLLPTLCSLINAHATTLPGVVEYALDLMGVIARLDEAGKELSLPFLELSLPCVLQFMTVSDDNAGLCSGAACLSAIIYSAKLSLQSVRLPNTNRGTSSTSSSTSTIDAIFSVVSRLLTPTFSEMGAACVGTLATQIVLCFGNTLSSDILHQLWHAMIMRLDTCRYGDLKMNIVLFFARLIHKDINSIVSVLMSMQIQGQDGQRKSAFAALMQCWTTEQPSFSGQFQVKATLLALSLIFQQYGGQCGQIMVKGDLIVNVNEGRRTRSQGKRKLEYQSIPLPFKIVQLLLRAVDEPDEDEGPTAEEQGMGMGTGMGMSSGIFAPAEDFEEFMLSDIGSSMFWEEEEEEVATQEIVDDELYMVDLQQRLLLFFKQRTAEEMNNIGIALNNDDSTKLRVVAQMCTAVVQ
jgi:hypothetical protein